MSLPTISMLTFERVAVAARVVTAGVLHLLLRTATTRAHFVVGCVDHVVVAAQHQLSRGVRPF